MIQAQMIKMMQTQLGFPSIDLEITEEQLKACIDMAVMMAKDHMQIRRYKSYTVSTRNNKPELPLFSSYVDLSDLEFEVVTEVFRGDALTPYLYDQFYLVNYSTRGVPATLATAINIRSNVDALINRSWRVIGKTLYLDKYYTGVTIEFVPSVVDLTDVDDTYWQGWVLRYALALAKEQLGRIRGKFRVESNPYVSDAETLLSESSSEKESLLAEIEGKGLLYITR